ncbi:Zinc finger protein Gfi-1b, partial [Ophiophagus hannah]
MFSDAPFSLVSEVPILAFKPQEEKASAFYNPNFAWSSFRPPFGYRSMSSTVLEHSIHLYGPPILPASDLPLDYSMPFSPELGSYHCIICNKGKSRTNARCVARPSAKALTSSPTAASTPASNLSPVSCAGEVSSARWICGVTERASTASNEKRIPIVEGALEESREPAAREL